MDYEELNSNDTAFYVPEFQEFVQYNDYDDNSIFSNTNNDTLENTTMSSFTNNKKRGRSNSKKNDNGCYFFNRKINDVRVKIPCFATKSMIGTRIKSATTGATNNMYVGKNDEDLFFKVRIINGEIKNSTNGNDFYYDSPEEYERHLLCIVPQSIKNKWREKNQIAKLNKRILENETHKQEFTVIK